MANQTYDLTQTGQEVQNIINDANGAKNAAAQTTLTTDYVMLKDTSGNYHKIDKSSFTEAIRDTLATLLTNNDKGTTFNLVPAIASGDFGSVTPENLASVLGVGDLLKATGFVSCANTFENAQAVLDYCDTTIKALTRRIYFASGLYGEIYTIVKYDLNLYTVYQINAYSASITIKANRFKDSAWTGWESISFS